MANYANLDSYITTRVYENANNEISGQDMQDVLLQIVQEMGKSGFLCQGVATTLTTPPVSSDSNIYYFAKEAGTYSNFGGLVVGVGEVALFVWNGSTWDKQTISVVDIIDNLTTNDANKALSARQGKVLKDAMDENDRAITEALAEGDMRLASLEQTRDKMGDGEADNLSVRHIPMVCNAPMVLFGAGTPSASTEPTNWNADTMGVWVGVPCFTGQLYVDTTAGSNALYVATGSTSVSDWKTA